MASERFAMRDESYGFFNCKAPPTIISERHTIIEDYRGMQFHYSSPVAAQTRIINPADQYFYATKDEYQGSSWPKTDSTHRPPLPQHRPRGYNPQAAVIVGNQIPKPTRMEVSQTAGKPITSDEAARRFGGFVITEYRTKKQHRA